MAEQRYTLMFYAAILTAAGATFGVYRVLENTKAESRVETVNVIVAASDLPEGSAIERTAISVRAWPVGTVPEGSYSSPDSVVGRVTRVAVFAGDPIVPGRLAPEGTGPGIEVKIAPGKRAMAVKIDEVAGMSGLIQPNSRVDVLVTLKAEGQTDRQVAKLFMSNMRVLSVGTQVERGEDGKAIQATTAALEVTPEETERLAVAVKQGTIQLVLRGYGDPDSIQTQGADSRDVMGQLRTAAVVTPPPAPRPAARAPARPAARPTAPAPTPTVVVQQPPAPTRPDSGVVNVFRGDKVSQQKVETDTTRRLPVGTVPPPPAAQRAVPPGGTK